MQGDLTLIGGSDRSALHGWANCPGHSADRTPPHKRRRMRSPSRTHLTMSDDEPVVLTLDEETESEDERLLASIDLSKFRTSAHAKDPALSSRPMVTGSPPVPYLPPSPKRPRGESVDAETARKRRCKVAQERKAAQALAREHRKALAEAKRQERAQARQEKEDAIKAKKLGRIRRAFSYAASRGTFRREEVDILVSRQLFGDTRSDILSHARALFPTQIMPVDMSLQNLVTWRRKPGIMSSSVQGGLEDKISLLIFSGAHFWELISLETLDEYAEYILSERQGEKITFLIHGIESECKKRTRQAVQPGSKENIISLQAVQDCYTLLFMQYGIRTHAFNSQMDVSKYILELTDAFTEKAYHEQDNFLDATLRYRDSRKKVSNRSTVISTRELPEGQSVLDLHGEEGAPGIQDEYNVLGEDGSVIFPCMRAEGRDDLGFMYLSALVLIPRVSIEKAMAIRGRYPTLGQLLEAYKRCRSLEEQYELLADLRCGSNGRRIGPALSKAIATILTTQDPNIAFQM